MKYIDRQLEKIVKSHLKQYPIIGVTGPRQSGKTTLLKKCFKDYKYISLENLDFREFAANDPNGFLKMYSENVILDEVQRVPELFSYLQTKVDESNLMGQYILSGSQNFHLMNHISQSLAGRIALFKLMPFDLSELQASQKNFENWSEIAIKGFYPAIYQRNLNSQTYFSNYISSYIERDIRFLTSVHNLNLFKSFIKHLAVNAGQILNLNKIAQKCGISQPTAKSWLSLLETSYIVYNYHFCTHFRDFSKHVFVIRVRYVTYFLIVL